jgi:hypothetical protein
VGVRLREAGRFASKSTANAILNIRQIIQSSLGRRIVEYVVNRQNDAGGYAFALSPDSNALARAKGKQRSTFEKRRFNET